MSIGAIDSSDPLSLEEWLKDARVGEFQRKAEERILRLLFNSDPTSLQFQQMVEQLARVGTDPRNRVFLEREIAHLNQDTIVPCGLKSAVCKVGQFFADHTLEILAGAAIVATGVGIAVVTGYALSASVGGVVVAGANSIFNSEEKPNPHIPKNSQPCSTTELAALQRGVSPQIPLLDLPSSPNDLWVTADGIWANGQFYSNSWLMSQSLIAGELKRGISPDYAKGFLFQPPLSESIANAPIIPEQLVTSEAPTTPRAEFSPPIPKESPKVEFEDLGRLNEAPIVKPNRSRKFILEGEEKSSLRFMWINGINNTFTESKTSALYIQALAGGYSVAGVYNCTHGPTVDVLESAFLNYAGYSPNTAKLLKEEWTRFHEARTHRPNAKLLQICHSQGAIAVKNALESLPQEIGDRVIVVAIAPAAIVPTEICFKSYNYASEKDFIYMLQPPPINSVDIDAIANGYVMLAPIDGRVRHLNELVILPAHPDAKGIDHEFQSPTYEFSIKKVLENYERHDGEYRPEEKGKCE